jgi:exodeoxyribonuclease VII large subunit
VLQPALVRFDDAKETLLNAVSDRVRSTRNRLELSFTALEASSPLAVMERGFSLVINEKSGKVIRRADAVKPGDRLVIRPLVGIINAVAESVQKDDGNAGSTAFGSTAPADNSKTVHKDNKTTVRGKK